MKSGKDALRRFACFTGDGLMLGHAAMI